ncbi:hypothetical protein [Nevskia sp.]|uniref:hypothetical protein n=1 Tax=Nevskia sp. TaxID=1929292 RepID=UPI0025F5A9B8|nr:hypothetical protein [Nevskia sp.]
MNYGITFSLARELFKPIHDWDADQFRMALYSMPLDQSITAYTATGELVGGEYQPGGAFVDLSVTQVDGTVTVEVSDASFILPAGAAALLIYNQSKAGRSVFVAPLDDVDEAGSLNISFTVPLITISV